MNRILPFIVSFKVQIYSGLSLKLIFTPIGQVKFLSPIFKLFIETILEFVVPVISDESSILTSFPIIDIGVIYILPKEENTEPFVIEISLKVSPGELNVGVPPRLHSWPPFIEYCIEHLNSVPSVDKVNLSLYEHVIG